MLKNTFVHKEKWFDQLVQFERHNKKSSIYFGITYSISLETFLSFIFYLPTDVYTTSGHSGTINKCCNFANIHFQKYIFIDMNATVILSEKM